MDTLWQRVRQARRQLACASCLLPIYAGVYYLAYWLRFDGQPDRFHLDLFWSTIAPVLLVKCLVFGWFRLYQGWSRHVTFHDLLALVQASTASSVILALGDYLLLPSHSAPRSVFLMDWGATIVFVGGLRAGLRALQEGQRLLLVPLHRLPVLIAGADDSGEALLRTLRLKAALPYDVVGFLTADPDRLAMRISGVPVVGTVDKTGLLVRKYGVGTVLVAAGDLSGRQIRTLVEQCRETAVEVKVLPSYEEMIRGHVAVQPRPVSIEDLLRREPARLEMKGIGSWIDGRVVMVTGSAGSIGSEICRQLLQFAPRRLILVDRSENGQFHIDREFAERFSTVEVEVCIADIADEPRMRRLLHEHRPDILFHAAAYKHVPLMEANPGEAVKNTTLATFRLANLAEEFGVGSFVMISTDKAVNPTNVMGACKRVAELYIQSLADESNCRFVTVRFGNVLDSAGSVVPIFREQIARGGPITVTDPRMQRYFMTIPVAAQLVIQAGTMGQGGEIFVLDMGEPVRILDLAEDCIRLSGLRVGEDIEIQFIGLRPGEKLYEELHVVGEKHLPTRHAKIRVAQRMPHNVEAIRQAIRRLGGMADHAPESIIDELRRIVPEYQPYRAQPLGPSMRAA
jgi:FlaA1/EpsC-like NDP-sugar epimerase